MKGKPQRSLGALSKTELKGIIKELAVRYSGKRWEKHVIDGYKYAVSGKPEHM
jgi:hypothetical protein